MYNENFIAALLSNPNCVEVVRDLLGVDDDMPVTPGHILELSMELNEALFEEDSQLGV